MKFSTFIKFSAFGLSTIIFKRKKAILGTIILTDKCNLSCKHCIVNNLTTVIYPYEHIKSEMQSLYKMGIRILLFCGGETYDMIMQNIRDAATDNICLYMSINQINKQDIRHVCGLAQSERNIKAATFNFHTPCYQCVVMENGRLSVCGGWKCRDIPGLCGQCGYFFAAEYSLIFNGKIRVIWDMLFTYLKYI